MSFNLEVDPSNGFWDYVSSFLLVILSFLTINLNSILHYTLVIITIAYHAERYHDYRKKKKIMQKHLDDYENEKRN